MTRIRARRSLAGTALYSRPGDALIDLSDNTNRWGAAPSARAVIASGAVSLSRYPEPYADSLREAVAEYLGVSADQITTGCGSDCVLDHAIRAFGEPGDRIAIPEPTFPVPAAFARANALEPMLLPLGPDYQPDPDAITATGARLVYLCSPNNPLGVPCSAERVAAIARATDGLVIVDEAYAEFAGRSFVGLIAEHPNLLVVRTMSKAFGLAGLRVGYAVGAPEVVRGVECSRGPYQVSALAIAAAIATLRNDREWMLTHARLAKTAREQLASALRQRGLDPLPSAANFVLVPVRDASRVADAMRGRGVGVRAMRLRPVSPALAATEGEALRITVGPDSEMTAALEALDAARAEVSCA